MVKSENSIILLRGLGRDARHWGLFPEDLEKALPGFKVHAIDLPGTGEYYDINSPLSVNKIAQFLHKESLKKNYIAENTFILGLSLGGMVASQWALNEPESIKKVVLVNSSFSNFSMFYHRLNPAVYWDFVKMSWMSPEEREVCVLKIVSANEEQYKNVAERWKHLWKEKPFKVSTVVRQLIAASLFSLRKLPKQEVLFLASRNDRLVSSRCYDDIANKTHWSVEFNNHAGHEMPMDTPEWVVQKAASFLSKIK